MNARNTMAAVMTRSIHDVFYDRNVLAKYLARLFGLSRRVAKVRAFAVCDALGDLGFMSIADLATDAFARWVRDVSEGVPRAGFLQLGGWRTRWFDATVVLRSVSALFHGPDFRRLSDAEKQIRCSVCLKGEVRGMRKQSYLNFGPKCGVPGRDGPGKDICKQCARCGSFQGRMCAAHGVARACEPGLCAGCKKVFNPRTGLVFTYAAGNTMHLCGADDCADAVRELLATL